MPKQHNATFYLSLIGGILILLASLSTFAFSPAYYGYGYMGNMMSYMMGNYYSMGYGMMGGFYYLPLVGIVSAVVVLYGAYMLSNKPKESKTWGILILIFSAVSLVNGGGFFIGAILGILGGIFALSKK